MPPLQPSPTDEPDPGPTTSLTEIASVGPAETASSPDTTDSSTTTSLADASTTDATSTIPSPTATTVTIPHPPPTNPPDATSDSNSTGGSFTLGRAEVAGISVGGVIGGLLLLFVVFLLIRRRKLAKRMPSFVDARGDQFDEKLMHDNQKAAVGGRSESHGDDVFAPFGGKYRNCTTPKPQMTYKTHIQ